MYFTLIHFEKKPVAAGPGTFTTLPVDIPSICVLGRDRGRGAAGGGEPFPSLSTSHLCSPLLFVRAAQVRGDHWSFSAAHWAFPPVAAFSPCAPSAGHPTGSGWGRGGHTRCCPTQFPAALPGSGGGTCGQQNTSERRGVKCCSSIQAPANARCQPPTLPSVMGTP